MGSLTYVPARRRFVRVFLIPPYQAGPSANTSTISTSLKDFACLVEQHVQYPVSYILVSSDTCKLRDPISRVEQLVFLSECPTSQQIKVTHPTFPRTVYTCLHLFGEIHVAHIHRGSKNERPAASRMGLGESRFLGSKVYPIGECVMPHNRVRVSGGRLDTVRLGVSNSADLNGLFVLPCSKMNRHLSCVGALKAPRVRKSARLGCLRTC